MITTEIIYNGKTYVCRMVKDSLDDDLIIAGSNSPPAPLSVLHRSRMRER